MRKCFGEYMPSPRRGKVAAKRPDEVPERSENGMADGQRWTLAGRGPA